MSGGTCGQLRSPEILERIAVAALLRPSSVTRAEPGFGVSLQSLVGMKPQLPVIFFRDDPLEDREHPRVWPTVVGEHGDRLAADPNALIHFDPLQEQWDRVMAVNVKSIMLTSKYAVPQMKRTGGGAIINISSIAGLRANRSTPYTTSKAAVIGITQSMAGDHGRDGIRVNCIAPGLVYGPMVAPRMDAGLRERRREASPLGVEGNGWDVAWAAVFLASDEARWITGVVLPVDAGLLVTTPVTYDNLAQQQY